MNETMSIGTFAKHVGVAASTLRYYEREGLTPRVPRDESGHRMYGEELERWVRFLTRLRTTGMPIRDVKAYVEALRLGADGDPLRMALLQRHGERLRAGLAQFQECLTIVERKLANGCGPVRQDPPPPQE